MKHKAFLGYFELEETLDVDYSADSCITSWHVPLHEELVELGSSILKDNPTSMYNCLENYESFELEELIDELREDL